MWNSLVAGLSLASVLSGTGMTPPMTERSLPGTVDIGFATRQGPAPLRIRQVTPTRAFGVHVGALGLTTENAGWGTVGVSYGISIGDHPAVEGTVDLAMSAGRLGGLGSLRFLGRRPTREGECYAILGAAHGSGLSARGRALLLGAGARFTLTEEIALATELHLLFFEATPSIEPIGARAMVGIVLRRE